jgi:hypothetical protein
MFLACKLHNCPIHLSDCAVIMMYAAMRIIKEPLFSTELHNAFQELKYSQQRHGQHHPAYRAKWDVRSS